jgi:hypothetical protein
VDPSKDAFDLEALRALDRAHNLHPFTDHGSMHRAGTHVRREARGCTVVDETGHACIDALAGLWCVNVGYGRAEIADAVAEQMRAVAYYPSFFNTTTEPAIRLAARLAELSPAPLTRAFFTNSGSEANETALKLIRGWWKLRRQPQMAAIGREVPLEELGLEHYGLDASGRTPPYPRDGRLRIADGLYAVGDAAGPELHTHQAHYQGEVAVRMALGEDVTPDYRALPRATYMDPEAAFVGMTLEQARDADIDAFELTVDYATSTKGYGIEAKLGHITIVVDRASRGLVGAATACPDASAAIHECVIAIQGRLPMDVLAAAIHAFPSTSRIFNGLFADALRELDHPGSVLGS